MRVIRKEMGGIDKAINEVLGGECSYKLELE